SQIRHAHHHEEVQVAGGHISRFHHSGGSAAFGGAFDVTVLYPTHGVRVELRVHQVTLELTRPADFKGQVAADEDTYSSITRNAVKRFTNGNADFVKTFGPRHRRRDAVGEDGNDRDIHLWPNEHHRHDNGVINGQLIGIGEVHPFIQDAFENVIR